MILQQKLCQLNAHSPAATKLFGGAIKIFIPESQPLQGFLHFTFEVMNARHLQQLLQVGSSLYYFNIFFRFVVGAFRKLVVQFVQIAFHLLKMNKCKSSFLPNCS